jgi:hypothetical protein
MAAATRYLVKGQNKVVINVTGVFSAADETDTVLIDLSALTGPDGTAPTAVRVDEITWTVFDIDYVQLEWDHDTDDVVERLSGQGYMDFRPAGGKNDPRSTGGTGDLILSTIGGAAGGAFSLLIAGTLKD